MATPPPPPPPPNPHDLAAISVASRISSFWPQMPKLWFAHFESIMAPQKLADEARFDLVIGKLARDELSVISDILENPPSTKKYDTVKKRLLAAFQESSEQQFQKLVKEMDLGQQKPSQLLRRMQELARNSGVTNEPLKNLWMARLPTAVRAVLAVSQDSSLEALGEMADKIAENLKTGEVAEVAGVSSSSFNTAASPSPGAALNMDMNIALMRELRNLSLEMKSLRGEVNEIRDRQRYHSRQRQRSSSARRSMSRSSSRQSGRQQQRRTPSSPDWLCSQHYRYKEKARFCQQPCNWNANEGN